MKKKFSILMSIIFCLVPVLAFGQENEQVEAIPSGENIIFDGEEIAIDAYLVNDENYVMLRDVASLLTGTEAQFAVKWNDEDKLVEITKGLSHEENLEAKSSNTGNKKGVASFQPIIDQDGKAIELQGYLLDGNNYFRLRDLGQEFDFGVAYDYINKTVIIDSSDSDIEDITEESVKVSEVEDAINEIEDFLSNSQVISSNNVEDIEDSLEDINDLLENIEDQDLLKSYNKRINSINNKLDREKDDIERNEEIFNTISKVSDLKSNYIRTENGKQEIIFTIYGHDGCGFCRRLKAYLDDIGISYSVVRNPEIKEIVSIMQGGGVIYYPSTIITLTENGGSKNELIVGFNEEKYEQIFEDIKNNKFFD